MNNSVKIKRRLSQTLTYLYLIDFQSLLSILFITIMSAFKAGNVVPSNSTAMSISVLITSKGSLQKPCTAHGTSTL